jgi:hypothetical protein
MMILAVIGTRVVFALPLDLRANWIFRVTSGGSGTADRTGSRRAMWLLAVAPVLAGEAAVCLWFWPSWQTLVHLTALGLLGLIVAELCLIRLEKIPFACSYLPGKLRYTFVPLAVAALQFVTVKGVLWECRAMQDWGTAVSMLTGLAGFWAVAAWVARREWNESRFEEEFPPAVPGLGLSRDGAMTVELVTATRR